MMLISKPGGPSLMRRVHDFIVARAGIYSRLSYSQEGEDLILERLFQEQYSGFYVDVGAHHPKRFSNTHRFYQRGWRGINIEPNPDGLALFHRRRKRDINLGYGVANKDGELVYYMFNEPALNTFDRAVADQRPTDRYRIVATKSIPIRRLSEILKEYLPPHIVIDFMTIDVEGLDLDVVESNDWSQFRPVCLLVEATQFKLENPRATPIHSFLESHDYELFAKTVNTLFYRDKTRKQSQAS
jgi:FkbM family methyltransferase